MSEQIYLKSTPLQEIRESGILGRPLHSVYSQLRIVIEERRGRDLAQLLAEPVLQQEEGTLDWYGFGEKCQPMVELSGELQQQVKTKLHNGYLELEALARELAASVEETDKQMASALKGALVVPADENIYWVDGRPVLALWGCHQSEGDLASWHDEISKKIPGVEAVATKAEIPQKAGGEQGVWKYVVIGSRYFWTVFFIALLVLLLSFIFSRCSGGSGQLVTTATPPNEITGKLEQGRNKEQELRNKIEMLQQEKAQKRSQCTDNTTVTERITNENDQKAFDESLEEENATAGEITVTLKWNNRNDLDLYVHCPDNGVIYYKTPKGCNGNLDVDKNYKGEWSKSPVENINWLKGRATPGLYQVSVKYHKRQDMAVAPETLFQVRLQKGEKDSIFEGSLGPGQIRKVTTFTVAE